MDMKLLLGATALVCLALGPVAGHAAQSKGRAANLDTFMQQWDPDHDGTLSLDEVKKAADARFDVLDTDHDGTLDKKELRGVLSAQDVSKADGDKDGTLDKAEYEAIVANRFQTADPDHDGTLDKKELGSPAGKALMRLLQ
jgi:Ca2+-binding EF-hand superfamily protein